MREYVTRFNFVLPLLLMQFSYPLDAAESIWYKQPKIDRTLGNSGSQLTVCDKNGNLKKLAGPLVNHKYRFIEYSVCFGGFDDYKRFGTQAELLTYLRSIGIAIETYPWDNVNYFDTSDTGSNCFIFQLYGPPRGRGGGSD